MPFKSEKQRRYLWANEPEIARDWTDTYGSKIHAADGGIMRLGYIHGGIIHPDGRRGFPGGAGTPGGYDGGSGSSSGSGNQGGHQGGGGGEGGAAQQAAAQRAQAQLDAQRLNAKRAYTDTSDDRFQNYATNPIDINTNVAPGEKGGQGYVPPQQENFIQQGIGKLQDFYTQYGMIPNIIKFGQNLFKGSGWDSSMGPRLDMGYNPNRINPFQQPDVGGGDGQQQQPPPWWYDDAYAQNILEDEYAQNILENEELDIDTSTGDMDEWIQRFRVKDPYRQDRGALDEQIREYVSKLYT